MKRLGKRLGIRGPAAHSWVFVRRPAQPCPTDIAHWRREIFSRLLTIVLVLGLVTAVPCIAIAIAVRERMWPMIGVVLLSTAWLVGVWYLTALSYMARALNFIAIVFFISIGLMVNVGHVAQIFLIAPPVFASVLLGMRPALVALAISVRKRPRSAHLGTAGPAGPWPVHCGNFAA